jgi:hypothetical protein
MEIIKSDARTVTLDRYSIEREASDEPVKVRAWLTVSTPGMKPAQMRLRVDYEYSDIPNPNEIDFARRLLQLLRSRFDEP